MKNNIFKRICGIFAVAFMLSVLAPAAFAQVDLGVIGGADGPTSIYVTAGDKNIVSLNVGTPADGEDAKVETETDIDASGANENTPEVRASANNPESGNNTESGNNPSSSEDPSDSQENDEEAGGSEDPFIVRLIGGGILNMINVGGGAMNVAITIAMYVLCALVAYALGSLNFGIIISKLIYKDDIRKYGSGNAGTTNMLRTYGKKAAIATILGDALKVVFAVLIGNIIVGALFFGGYVAGFFAVLGHVYPVYYKFKGGKGVVASAITILMLDWRVFLVVLGVFVIVVAIWRYISLGSIIASATYPMITYAAAVSKGTPGGLDVVFAFILAVFVILLHRTNIQRLLDGKENKLSFKKTDKKAADKK